MNSSNKPSIDSLSRSLTGTHVKHGMFALARMGIRHYQSTWDAVFYGLPEDLIKAGVVESKDVPGMPGGPKTSKTYVNELGQKVQIVKHGRRIEVAVRLGGDFFKDDPEIGHLTPEGTLIFGHDALRKVADLLVGIGLQRDGKRGRVRGTSLWSGRFLRQ